MMLCCSVLFDSNSSLLFIYTESFYPSLFTKAARPHSCEDRQCYNQKNQHLKQLRNRTYVSTVPQLDTECAGSELGEFFFPLQALLYLQCRIFVMSTSYCYLFIYVCMYVWVYVRSFIQEFFLVLIG